MPVPKIGPVKKKRKEKAKGVSIIVQKPYRAGRYEITEEKKVTSYC